jgi:hypothetical protein
VAGQPDQLVDTFMVIDNVSAIADFSVSGPDSPMVVITNFQPGVSQQVIEIQTLIDQISTTVVNYTTIYSYLASAQDPSSVNISGFKLYLLMLEIIVNNINVTNRFLTFLKGQIATAGTSAQEIIIATENYLNFIINSTDNINQISQSIQQGGWNTLLDRTNAIFSMMPGFERNIIASAIAVCSKTDPNDFGGETQLISGLTDLYKLMKAMHYLFDISYTIGTVTDDTAINDATDVQLGSLFDLLALIKRSYADLIANDIQTIYSSNGQFLTVFINVFPLKFGNESYRVVNGIIQQITSTGQVRVFDFFNPYVSTLNTHHFDNIIANMNVSLTTYLNSIRSNVKLLQGKMIQLFYNNANYRFVS